MELPPLQRAAVVLRFYEDWTVAQIADALSLSTGSVKRYLSDGVHRLEGVVGPMPGSRASLDDDELMVDVRRKR